MKLATLVGSLALCTPALAQETVLFDFDSGPQYTSLPVNLTVGGLTAHLSATGQGFSIQSANAMGFTPAGFAGLCIYPNSVYAADLLVSFDKSLTGFSIMYAPQELGCDDSATMRVTAYLDGILVGTNTTTCPNPGTYPTGTLAFTSGTAFNSVLVHYDHRPPTCQDYGVIFLADNMYATLAAPPLCYANCDASTTPPILNVADFSCFLTRYAGGDAYANCDGSVQPPVLNVADFSCFLVKYAAGCP